ncbi:MAG TPA: DUF3568 family protein [Clostridia bacterium]|nr:DUF3568 family protein [Clostridia bacterium]
MKTTILMVLLAALIAGTGCVGTVTGRTKAGVPFVKDWVEGRYERPLEDVFAAAKDVVRFNGTMVNEATLHNQTNLTKTVEGKVNQRNVFIRVEALNPTMTGIVVQARTTGGGADIHLAHEIEKQVALKLVR